MCLYVCLSSIGGTLCVKVLQSFLWTFDLFEFDSRFSFFISISSLHPSLRFSWLNFLIFLFLSLFPSSLKPNNDYCLLLARYFVSFSAFLSVSSSLFQIVILFKSSFFLLPFNLHLFSLPSFLHAFQHYCSLSQHTDVLCELHERDERSGFERIFISLKENQVAFWEVFLDLSAFPTLWLLFKVLFHSHSTRIKSQLFIRKLLCLMESQPLKKVNVFGDYNMKTSFLICKLVQFVSRLFIRNISNSMKSILVLFGDQRRIPSCQITNTPYEGDLLLSWRWSVLVKSWNLIIYCALFSLSCHMRVTSLSFYSRNPENIIWWWCIKWRKLHSTFHREDTTEKKVSWYYGATVITPPCF